MSIPEPNPARYGQEDEGHPSLADQTLTIDEIVYLLGCSGPSGFHRALRMPSRAGAVPPMIGWQGQMQLRDTVSISVVGGLICGKKQTNVLRMNKKYLVSSLGGAPVQAGDGRSRGDSCLRAAVLGRSHDGHERGMEPVMTGGVAEPVGQRYITRWVLVLLL